MKIVKITSETLIAAADTLGFVPVSEDPEVELTEEEIATAKAEYGFNAIITETLNKFKRAKEVAIKKQQEAEKNQALSAYVGGVQASIVIEDADDPVIEEPVEESAE